MLHMFNLLGVLLLVRFVSLFLPTVCAHHHILILAFVKPNYTKLRIRLMVNFCYLYLNFQV